MCEILSNGLLDSDEIEYETFDNIAREIKRCLKSDYFYDEIKKCLHPKEEYRPTDYYQHSNNVKQNKKIK